MTSEVGFDDWVASAHETLQSFAQQARNLNASKGSDEATLRTLLQLAHSLQALVVAAHVAAVLPFVRALEDWLQRVWNTSRAVHEDDKNRLESIARLLSTMLDATQMDSSANEAASQVRVQLASLTSMPAVSREHGAGDEVPWSAALTASEQGRLAVLIQQGAALWSLTAHVPISELGLDLEMLKAELSVEGEVIAAVPTGERVEGGFIALELFVAAEKNFASKSTWPKRVVSAKWLKSGQAASVQRATPATHVWSVRVSSIELEALQSMGRRLAQIHETLARARDGLGVEVRTLGESVSELNRQLAQLVSTPLESLFSKLSRMMEPVIARSEHSISLSLEGGQVQVPRRVADELGLVLMHLLRNAVAHGAQEAQRRIMVGKPPTNQLMVRAQRDGQWLILEVLDDGQGIDDEAIARVAVERGWLTPAVLATMSPQERSALIFTPGLSTRGEVNDISGRGVGLDAVKSQVERWGGTVEVDSDSGRGTTFRLRVPIES